MQGVGKLRRACSILGSRGLQGNFSPHLVSQNGRAPVFVRLQDLALLNLINGHFMENTDAFPVFLLLFGAL